MKKSISIDNIRFQSLKKNNNRIVRKYDKTKMDKSREGCSDKNLRGNPKNPNAYIFSSLGMHTSLNEGFKMKGFFAHFNRQ